jgi:membrane-bound ClpP family serine protease
MTAAVVCRDLQAALSAYVDHEASPDEVAQVEAHVQSCSDCAVRLKRYARQTHDLERQIRDNLQRGEALVRGRMHRKLLVGDTEPQARVLSAFATVGMLALIAVALAIAVVRSAPPNVQQTQPAAQAEPPPSAYMPVVWISLDGVVDPAVASYVRRASQTATTEHALLLLDLDSAGGLDASLRDVLDVLRTSQAPTAAHLVRTNAVTTQLAQAAHATMTAIPSQAQKLEMEPLEAVWHWLLDPSIAYLLFTIGLYALFVEIAHPGAIVPGISGVVCLGLASVGFITLPINPFGALVLIAGVAFMGIELKAPSHGILTLAGVAGLSAGSLWLYTQQLDSTIHVAPTVVGLMLIGGAALGITLARIALRVRALPPVFDLEQLIGARGVARGGLTPDGVVHVKGQLWSARVRGPHIEPGESVRVLARQGLVLEVESATHRSAATQKGAVQ